MPAIIATRWVTEEQRSMFLFSKNQALKDMLADYLRLCGEAFDVFREAMEHVLRHGLDEHFDVLAQRTHQRESEADDRRRQIELEMYRKALLPESREDLLEIIERLDRIPNQCEDTLRSMLDQQLTMLPCLTDTAEELLKLSADAFRDTLQATRDLLGKMDHIAELVHGIDNAESVGDGLEQRMVRTVFALDIDLAEKLWQKQLIGQLGALCDLCEAVADRITICSVKRQV